MYQERMSSLTYFLAHRMTPELRRNQFGPMVGQYGYGYSVRNETRFTIAIVNRAGLRTMLPPMKGRGNLPGSVNLRYVNAPAIGVISDVDDQYSAGEIEADAETRVWNQALFDRAAQVTQGIRGLHGVAEAAVVYQVTEADLVKNAGCLYVANLDVVIAVMDGTRKLPPVHPFSRLGSTSLVREHTNEVFGDSGVLYAVKIVDRRAAFGDRFMNLGGRVVHVKAESDTTVTLLDGVYVTANIAANGKMIEVSRDTEYYSFAEADAKLPLYRTYDEALTLGNPEEIRKRELEDLRREIDREKHDQQAEILADRRKLHAAEELFETQKRDHARDILRQQQELEQTKLNQLAREARLRDQEQEYREREHFLKTESLSRKHQYETQSDQRKATLEVLKYVPSVVGGVITAIAIYKKIKS